MSRFENRKYVILSQEEVADIDFEQVLETSANTLRYSVDGTETFVKYEGEKPSSIPADATEYTHSEIISILATEAWTTPIEEE